MSLFQGIYRVAVTGGRNYNNPALVWKTLDQILDENPQIVLVVGDCPTGADLHAREWAESRCITFPHEPHGFPANWKKHGKSAGPKRNKDMVDFGFDLLFAFPGGAGTANMIKLTRYKGIKVIEV